MTVSLKSATVTFNHLSVYMLEEGQILYRRIDSSEAWKSIPFHSEARPVFIDADGANLIVVDALARVHFKKVLSDDEREDLSGHENWRNRWCVLPVLGHLIHLFADYLLKVDGPCAISHRGRFNRFVEDAAGQRHESRVGVSTLYVLDESGRFVSLHDPWSPPWSLIRVYFPPGFVCRKMSVSASTIMALGTQKIITRLADIDTEGGNPWFRYRYHADDQGEKTWVLPVDADWQEHPWEAGMGGSITILQTGEGKHARLMRVSAKSGGYYEKKLTDHTWSKR